MCQTLSLAGVHLCDSDHSVRHYWNYFLEDWGLDAEAVNTVDYLAAHSST